MEHANGIEAAITKAESVREIADKLGVTHQAIYKWRKLGWVPQRRALDIERLWGVPRKRLLKPSLVALLEA